MMVLVLKLKINSFSKFPIKMMKELNPGSCKSIQMKQNKVFIVFLIFINKNEFLLKFLFSFMFKVLFINYYFVFLLLLVAYVKRGFSGYILGFLYLVDDLLKSSPEDEVRAGKTFASVQSSVVREGFLNVFFASFLFLLSDVCVFCAFNSNWKIETLAKLLHLNQRWNGYVCCL